MYSLRVRSVPLFRSSQRLGAFAFSSHPGVRGFPALRLLCPFRLPRKASDFSYGSRLPTSTVLNILPRLSRVPTIGLNQDDLGGVFLGAPSALCGSRDCSQGRIRFTCDALLARSLFARSGPHPSRTTRSFGSLADISGKVCQGLHYP